MNGADSNDRGIGRPDIVDEMYDILEKHSKGPDGGFLAGDAVRSGIVTDLVILWARFNDTRAIRKEIYRDVAKYLRCIAKPGTQPADYYERAAEMIEQRMNAGDRPAQARSSEGNKP